MIYLIKAAGYSIDGGYEDQLKIGYTSEGKSRFDAYWTHNPTHKILYRIPLWSLRLEQKIHKFFENHLHVGDCKEWYCYSEDIIRFFEKFKNEKEEVVEKYMDEILKGRSYGYELEGDDPMFLKKYYIDCIGTTKRLELIFTSENISARDLGTIGSLDIQFFLSFVDKDSAKELGYDQEKIRKLSLKNCEQVKEDLKKSIEVGEVYSKVKLEKIVKKLGAIYPITFQDLSDFLQLEEVLDNSYVKVLGYL